jgi:hypothetical protein
MTTHPDSEPIQAAPGAEYDGAETTAVAANPAEPARYSSVQGDVPAIPPTESPTAAAAGEDLFAAGDLQDLRSRWDEIQAAFVDDPKDCVHKADDLVSDVVEHLHNGFSSARSRLEEQWARGEQATTEDLRQALTQYRDFFQRLLKV